MPVLKVLLVPADNLVVNKIEVVKSDAFSVWAKKERQVREIGPGQQQSFVVNVDINQSSSVWAYGCHGVNKILSLTCWTSLYCYWPLLLLAYQTRAREIVLKWFGKRHYTMAALHEGSIASVEACCNTKLLLVLQLTWMEHGTAHWNPIHTGKGFGLFLVIHYVSLCMFNGVGKVH